MGIDSKAARLGEMLLGASKITEDELERALALQRKRYAPLGSILLSIGALDKETLTGFLAEHFGVPSIDLRTYSLDKSLKPLVPEAIARRHRCLPLFRSGDSIMVAMGNPNDIVAIDALAESTGLRVDVAYAYEGDIDRAIDRLYGVSANLGEEIGDISERFLGADRPEKAAPAAEIAGVDDPERAPIVKLVDLIVDHGVRRRASDIHIEPGENTLRLRYRIDGFIVDVKAPPRKLHSAIVARIKVQAELDIAESRLPQDGRFRHFGPEGEVDVRVSVIPTVHGENVVLRLIHLSQQTTSLDALGLEEKGLETLRRLIERPHGLVLVTGPTGSGKTSTLYAALREIDANERHLITIEDPVEYRLDVARQIAVNPKTGLTFAAGLRSILRHDPDVIMVGEIRDGETARIAVQAALTGHLVLSSLHTNDAPSSLTRLIDIGIEPFLVASATCGIVAQRLVRILCPDCRVPSTLPDEVAREAGLREAGGAVVYRRGGCPNCADTGFRGRTAIFETLVLDEAMRDAIASRKNESEIRAIAARSGLVPLRSNGIAKALRGVTSVEEVFRVTSAA